MLKKIHRGSNKRRGLFAIVAPATTRFMWMRCCGSESRAAERRRKGQIVRCLGAFWKSRWPAAGWRRRIRFPHPASRSRIPPVGDPLPGVISRARPATPGILAGAYPCAAQSRCSIRSLCSRMCSFEEKHARCVSRH